MTTEFSLNREYRFVKFFKDSCREIEADETVTLIEINTHTLLFQHSKGDKILFFRWEALEYLDSKKLTASDLADLVAF